MEGPPKVKGRSICHHLFKEKKIVFVSLDLETGGENCGIVQLSAELVRLDIKPEGEKQVAKDVLAGVEREGTTYNESSNPGGQCFNEYVHPGEDAEWSSSATQVHGLSRHDPRITSARNIKEV